MIAEMLDQTTKLLDKTFAGEYEPDHKSGGSLFQLGVNYRWSPIVLDERNPIEAAMDAEEDSLMEDYDFDDEEDQKIDSYGTLFDGRLRAGDRAPDSCGLIQTGHPNCPSTSHSLFQIFGSTHHTVLLFADAVDCERTLQQIRRYPPGLMKSAVIVKHRHPVPSGAALADYVFEDRDGHAHDAYTSRVCGLVVVRPDGIVGAILRGPSSLHQYFQTLLARP